MKFKNYCELFKFCHLSGILWQMTCGAVEIAESVEMSRFVILTLPLICYGVILQTFAI